MPNSDLDQVLLLLPSTRVPEQRPWCVRTADGRRLYEVARADSRLDKVLVLRDLEGRDVAHLNERFTLWGRAIVVDRPGVAPATVRRGRGSEGRDGWVVTTRGAPAVRVTGDVAAHECRFDAQGEAIATMEPPPAKGEPYTLTVRRGSDVLLVLAAAIALEQLTS